MVSCLFCGFRSLVCAKASRLMVTLSDYYCSFRFLLITRLPAARRYELRQEHPQALGFLLLMEAAARDYGSSCKV